MDIEKCRICFSNNITPFLDLGLQPWCNDFVLKEQVGQEKRYPLALYFCHQCSTVQVCYTVPKEIMYRNHLYLSGITHSMKEHFQRVADKVCYTLVPSRGLVVDIGSNDGTLLSCYHTNDMKVLGVEPCVKAANIAISKNITTNICFFNYKHAQEILQEYGKAKIISAANVFYHVEELHDIVKGIKLLLDENGVFVMQGSYLPRIMEKKAFDIMYHEHLLYYRIDTLKYLLAMYGLEIFDVDEADVHGGSIVAYVCHRGSRNIRHIVYAMHDQEIKNAYDRFETYEKFANNVSMLKDEIYGFVDEIKKQGNTIYAFGAPAKGTVLLNYCGLNICHIDCAVEKNEFKVGRYIPGTQIPIVHENQVEEPDYYFLLSWNFINEFKKSDAFISGKRKFIVPLPSPKVVSLCPVYS